jgi:hypothetical protein
MSPHSYDQLIFEKVPKTYDGEKNSVFNKYYWENWISACRKLKPDPCLLLCKYANSKWIKDLNIRPESLKQAQESIGKASKFLNSIPMAQHLRKRIDNWDYMKLRSFCTTKEMVTRLKKQPTE